MRNPTEVRSECGVDRRKQRARRTLSTMLGVLLALPVASCGSKGAVAVSAAIQDPVLRVSAPSPLVAALDGSFRLRVELGQMASSGTDISISEGAFRVARSDGGAPVLDLTFLVSPPAPHHLDPGEKLDLAFVIADKSSQTGRVISKDERAALCSSGQVQIAGSFQDGITGQVAVHSLDFVPSGCP